MKDNRNQIKERLKKRLMIDDANQNKGWWCESNQSKNTGAVNDTSDFHQPKSIRARTCMSTICYETYFEPNPHTNDAKQLFSSLFIKKQFLRTVFWLFQKKFPSSQRKVSNTTPQIFKLLCLVVAGPGARWQCWLSPMGTMVNHGCSWWLITMTWWWMNVNMTVLWLELQVNGLWNITIGITMTSTTAD